jgi:Ras-related protein Rab-5C
MGCANNQKQKEQKNSGNLKFKKNDKTPKTTVKEYEIKICLLGDVSVGKTSIASRFCKNTFNENYINTIGGAYQQQNIILNNGAKMKLHIWDTSGQDRFRSMTNLYYRDAQVAILTYDVTNEQSLESLSYWLKELNDKVDQDNMLLCLAGNKNDVDPKDKRVPTNKGKEFAEANNMIFFETSAKTGTGIKELFQAIATKEYAIINENK